MTTDEQALKLLAIAESTGQSLNSADVVDDVFSIDNMTLQCRGKLFGALIKLAKAKPEVSWQDTTMHARLNVGYFTFVYCHTPATEP